MTPLPKHLRRRWRYLAVALYTWPDAELDRDAVQLAVWNAARDLLGDVGSADLDLTVLRFAHEASRGYAIVRVRRGGVNRARAVLGCVSAIGGTPVGVRVTGASGTVRACSEKYIGREPEAGATRQVAFEGTERPAVTWDGRADVRTERAFVGATDLDLG